MATTKHKISEQVMRILKGSDQPMATNLHIKEVKEGIGQVINQLLKVESYNILQEKDFTGDVTPAGLVIATYGNQAVSQYKTNYAKLTLPAAPIRLPKDMGISITGVNDPFTSYIPVPPGLWQMVSEEPLISECLGQVAYERRGLDIIFTTDITANTPPITEVDVHMVIMDISQYDDFAPLPIPADMEADVVRETCKLFGIKQYPADKVDPISEPKPNTNQP